MDRETLFKGWRLETLAAEPENSFSTLGPGAVGSAGLALRGEASHLNCVSDFSAEQVYLLCW
jgi:hypothetical protein